MNTNLASNFRSATVLAVTIVMLVTLGVLAAPRASAAPDNGNASVAGSDCERALISLAGKMDGLRRGGQASGMFGCSNGVLSVELKEGGKTTHRFIGNTRTAATREVTGLTGDPLARAEAELGLDEVGARAAGDASNTCMPKGTGAEYQVFKDSSVRAHSNIAMCYGKFIYRGGVPVEIIWSDILRMQWTQILTSRNEHDFSLSNTSTSGQHQIGVTFTWNQKENRDWLPDTLVGEPDSVEDIPFNTGDVINSTYYPSQSSSKFYLTGTNIKIDVIDTTETVNTTQKIRMPDFNCTASSCQFP